MGITLLGRGFNAIRDKLDAIRGRAMDLRPLIEPIRAELRDANQVRALAGVGFDGVPYKKLAPSTVKQRVRKGLKPSPPLAAHGLYSRVIQGCRIGVAFEGNRLRITKSWPALPWLEYHIEGSSRLPQRNPMGWGAELQAVRDMLPRHVTIGRP